MLLTLFCFLIINVKIHSGVFLCLIATKVLLPLNDYWMSLAVNVLWVRHYENFCRPMAPWGEALTWLCPCRLPARSGTH